MQTPEFNTDVLVVGAGPVGLAVAIELGLRGVNCEVIDEVQAIGHWWTRAMNMNMRTMEHMRRWALADTLRDINFVPKGWPGQISIVERLGGRQLACVPAESLGGHRVLDYAAEDALWVAQGQVQDVLLKKARALGVAVGFGQRASALQLLDSGGVAVTIESAASSRVVNARFVVGCDGGRSMVRQAAGIPYKGAGALSRQISIFFRAPTLLADLRERGVSDALMYFCADPAVPGSARLIAGDRWEFTYRPPAGFDESQLDANAVVLALVGPHIPFELERSYPFSYFERLAEHFRQGPVFLAGDAAHMIPPLGGHNLNLGFGDAVNLGWKLAHVLRNWADESILDSYSVERLPMVSRTAAEAYRNYERLGSTFKRLAEVMRIDVNSPEEQKIRDALNSDIARDLAPQWHSEGTVLDQRYSASDALSSDDRVAPKYDSTRYQPYAAVGHRAPMWRDAAGVPLYDLFGPEYTLLCLGKDISKFEKLSSDRWKQIVPVTVLHIPEAEVRELYGANYVLIRPDQHVAWRGNIPPSPGDFAAHLSGHTYKAEYASFHVARATQ